MTIWGVVAACCWLRRPVIRYQPRRPVSWGGLHVFFTFLLYFLLVGVAAIVIRLALAGVAGQGKVEPPSTAHPIVKMVQAAPGNLWVLLAAGAAAVVVAPIFEEFFFRVLLQGWLEAVARRRRRAWQRSWRFLSWAGPVLLTSLLFGAMHFRLVEPAAVPPPLLLVVAMLIADAVAKLVAMAGIVILLRTQCGATAADFGWAPEKLAGDVGLGLTAFLAALPPVYLLQFFSQKMADHFFGADKVAADPAAAVLLRPRAGDALLPDAPHRTFARHPRRPERHDAGGAVLADVEEGLEIGD